MDCESKVSLDSPGFMSVTMFKFGRGEDAGMVGEKLVFISILADSEVVEWELRGVLCFDVTSLSDSLHSPHLWDKGALRASPP